MASVCVAVSSYAALACSIASCASRAASASSFTGGMPSLTAETSATIPPTTAARPIAILTPGIEIDRRVDAFAAILATAVKAVRAPTAAPRTPTKAAVPFTKAGFAFNSSLICVSTSVPTLYTPSITGVNCSPTVVFTASQAEFIRVSCPFMLSSLIDAMRCAAPEQSLMLSVKEP